MGNRGLDGKSGTRLNAHRHPFPRESFRNFAKRNCSLSPFFDARFAVDEVPLVALIQKSLQLSWSRDPFDRLIAAHSIARQVPLCSVDSVMLENHKLLVPELR
jgi:hypothetical protein